MKVSVCVPVYNRQDLVAEALGSIFSQDGCEGLDLEVIVVDDGSTDDTVQVIRKTYGSKVLLISQENKGDAGARNSALRLAKGEFIAFQDSDDLWHPNKLKQQLDLLKRNTNVGLVYSPKLTVDMSGNEIHPPRRACHRGYITTALFQDIFIATPSVIIRRDVFETIGFFNEELPVASDYEYWLRASTRFQFDYVDEPLVTCRKHSSNITSKDKIRNQLVTIKVLESFLLTYPGIVPANLVGQKMAREYFKLGRLYKRSNSYCQAVEALKKSLDHKWSLRTWIMCVVCMGRKK